MSQPPRPCAHCGCATLTVIQNLSIDHKVMGSVLGFTAAKHVSGRYWIFSLVVCTQCGCTQMFTGNLQSLVKWTQSQTVTVHPR